MVLIIICIVQQEKGSFIGKMQEITTEEMMMISTFLVIVTLVFKLREENAW